jgi:hypothetical protein
MLAAQLMLDAYAGDNASGGITEGWLAWRPVPRSAWHYAFGEALLLGSELLEVRSERPERALLGLPADIEKRQLRVMLRATF